MTTAQRKAHKIGNQIRSLSKSHDKIQQGGFTNWAAQVIQRKKLFTKNEN